MTPTLESMLAIEPVGTPVDVAAPAVLIAGKDDTGKRTALVLDGDAVKVSDAQTQAKRGMLKGYTDQLEALIGAANTAVAMLNGAVQTAGQKDKDNSASVVLASNDDLFTQFSDLLSRIGEVQGTPTANTVLARLKDLTQPFVLGGGSAEIGRVVTKHFSIVATGPGILTRPTNQTAYAVKDSVSNSATASNVTAMPVVLSDINDDPIELLEIQLDSNDPGFADAYVNVHLFNADPTANGGVINGDNGRWLNNRAGYLGYFTGTMTGMNDGCVGVLSPKGPAVRILNPNAGGRTIYWQLQVMSVVTPANASGIFTPRFKGVQGRA